MIPGPVSDSYDPEFGTGANAYDVATGLRRIAGEIGSILGPGLKNIVEVAQGDSGPRFDTRFSEQELRLIRFGLNRALESM